MNEMKLCLIYSQGSNGKENLLVQLQICGLTAFLKDTPSQTPFYENCEVLQKVIFTEHRCAIAPDFL